MKNFILPLILLFSLSVFGQIPETALTAEYKFTNGRLDNAVGENDLSIIGTSSIFENNRASGPEKAILLNGDYLQRAGTSGFDVSVSFWIKTNTIDANKRVIIDQTERAGEAEGSEETGWYIYLQDGKISVAANFQWYHSNNTANGATGYTGYHYVESLGTIADGNWHHVTIVIDSYAGNFFNEQFQRTDRIIRNHYYLYLNGGLAASHDETKNVGNAIGPSMRRFINSSFPLTIANSKDGNSTNRFEDSFDDLRYYNTVLNASQVAQLAQETACSGTSGVSAFAQNIEVELDEFGNATITPEDIDDGSGEVCNEPFTLSLSKTDFTCADLGDNTVTLTVTETYGTEEVATADATVTVKYTPTVSTQNITIQLDASGQATITPEEVDNQTPATGVCGASLTLSLDKTTFSCADLGANTVTLTADDGNGNTGTATATVTVEDVMPPVVQVQDVAVNVDPATGFVTIDPASINDGSIDNCSISLIMSLSKTRFTCEDTGENTVTLMVEDENGNSTTADATVTVTSEVENEELTVLNASICPDGTSGTTISTASSVVGFNYFLRNSEDNVIVDGPIAGTGNALDFATGNLSRTSTFNVFTEKVISTSQSALEFDGVNDYVNLGNDDRGITSQVTVAAWVKTTTSGSSQFIASKYVAPHGYYLFLDANGKAGFSGRNDQEAAFQSGLSTTSVNDGEWHYVTGSMNASTGVANIYVDGELESSTTNSIGTSIISTTDLLLGLTSGLYFAGELDQVTLWNTALDQASILSNMEACLTGSETGIVGHFIFEDGSGTTLSDQSSSAIDGALINMDGATDWIQVISPSCGERACELQMANEITVGDSEVPTIIVQDIVAQIDLNTGVATITPDLIDNGSSDNCTSAGNLVYSLDKTSFACEDQGENEVTLTITDESGNESSATATVTVNSAINDETVTTAASASFCPDGSSATISTGSSVVGVNYFLRDSRNNSIVDGPLAGTGSGLDFNTGAVHATTTYNVYGTLNSTGGALDFDGVDDYVSLGNINRSVTTEVTVATWVKTAASGATNFIAGKFDFVNGWVLYVDSNGKVGIDGRDGTGTYKQSGFSTTSVNDNEWHYIVGSINISTGMWKIYVDGALESSANNGTGNTLACASLLTFGSFNTSYFTGQIDQFAIWHTELDASAITSFNTNCISAESETTLVALFDLNEESGTVVVDNSSHVSNGIMVNMDPAADRVAGDLACVEVCSQQMSNEITIGDSEVPTAIAQDITVDLDADGNATIEASDVNNASSDNCSTSLTFSLDQSSFTCADLGENTITLTVTDEAGNESTATSTVTVEDNVLPSVVSQNITVKLDENGNASIVASDIDNGSTDNCTETLSLILALDNSNFTCADVGENAVTLTVTDESGNEASSTASVTVEDVTVPTAIAQDITVSLDENGNVIVDPTLLDNESSDLCSEALSFSLDSNTFTCSDLGENTVTLTVTDESGNESTVDATITVEDNLAPTIVSQNITAQLDASGNVTVDASTLNASSSDNCTTSLTFALSKADFDCSDIGENTVSFSVTDESGNVAAQDVTITIEDNIAPIVTTQNVTVQLDADGNAAVTTAQINNGSSDVCSVSENLTLSLDQTTFSCANLGSNTVTLTVEDENGNSASATATVTVEDNIDPTAVAQDFTVRLDANNMASILASDVDGGSTDNCGSPTLSLDISSFNETNVGANTVTLTASDAFGNSATASATVTVQEYKQAQTITFTEVSDLTYGVGDQTLEASSSSSLAVSFNLISGPATLSGSALSITGVGEIVVEAVQEGNDDFLSASAEQTITVSKASLTVTADNQTITYGDAIPTLTFQYEGFVNGDSETDLISEPTIRTTAIATSDAGSYDIELAGGEADNYTISLVAGILTISKTDQTISITEIADKEPTDTAFEVEASIDSELTLSYEISGPATISGTTITLDGTEGTVTVTVSQEGDINHNAATASITFEVTVVLALKDGLSEAIKIYPNPVTNYIMIDTEEQVDVTFYGLNGQVIRTFDQVNGKLDVTDLQTGTYLMEVSNTEEKITVRIHKAN